MKKLLVIMSLCLGFFQVSLAQNIVAGEYFWNTDPGIGLGTALTPAEIAGGIGDETFDLHVTAPNGLAGQQILFVRFKLNDTLWSQAEGYPILVGPENLLAGAIDKIDTSEIKEIEYYWNGNANLSQTVIVPASDTTFKTTFGLSTSGAEIGNNLLNIRAKDKYGFYTFWQSNSVFVFGGLPEIDSIKYARFDSQYSYTGTPPNDFLNVNFQANDKLSLSVNTGNPADSSDVSGQKYIPAAGMNHGLNVMTFKVFGSAPVDSNIPSSEDSYFFQSMVRVDTTIKLQIGEPHLANNTLSTEFCPGGILKLPLQKIGNWPSINDYNIPTVFTIKLKDDNSQDFYAITTSLNTAGDTLIGILPENIPISGNNRVMVESSFPYITDTATTQFTSGLILTTFTGNASPCEGNVVFLNVNANLNSTYSWTGPAGYTATGSGPSRTNLRLADAGTYIVTGTSLLAGCTSTASLNIIVKPKPVTVVSSNSPVCEGQTIQLNSSSSNGGTLVSWLKITPTQALISNTNANHSINNVTLADSGKYRVMYALNGCSKLDTVQVIVKPLPVLSTINTNAPICSGNNLVVSSTATEGSTYSWTGPNGFSNTNSSWSISSASTATSGTYSLAVTLNGCNINTTLVNVVNQTPIVNTTSPVTICEASSLQLNVNATAGATYAWTGPNTYSSAVQNPVVSATASPSMSGTYSVTVSLGTCSANGTVAATVKQLPVISSLSTNAPICSGNNLVVGSTATEGSTYSWTGPNGFSNTNSSWSISSATTAASGTYSLAVTLNGCSINTTLVNVVNQTPTVNTTSPVAVCIGSPLQLNVNTTSGATYGWSGPNVFSSTTEDPQVSNSAILAMAGTYSVTVSLGSCSANGQVVVSVNPNPVLVITNQSAQQGGSVNLTLSAVTQGSTLPLGTTLSYFTNAGATNSLANPDNITVAGTYYIKATTASNCVDIKPVVVTICGGVFDPITDPITSGTVTNVSTQKITATNIVSGSGTRVTYRSTAHVELKPGFRADNGTIFKAKMGDVFNIKTNRAEVSDSFLFKN